MQRNISGVVTGSPGYDGSEEYAVQGHDAQGCGVNVVHRGRGGWVFATEDLSR